MAQFPSVCGWCFLNASAGNGPGESGYFDCASAHVLPRGCTDWKEIAVGLSKLPSKRELLFPDAASFRGLAALETRQEAIRTRRLRFDVRYK